MDKEKQAQQQVDNLNIPPAGSEPSFLNHPVLDQLLEIVISLGGEVWIERDRRIRLEALLESKGLASREELEKLILDERTSEQRNAALEAYVNRILAPLKTLQHTE